MTWTSKELKRIEWDGTIEALKFSGDGSQLTNLPAGTETDPLFMAASAAYNSHIIDTDIHTTSGSLWTSINLNDAHISSVSEAVVKAQANVDSTSSAVALAETHITAVSSAVVKAQANVDSVSSAYSSHASDTTIHYASGSLWTSINLNDAHISSVSSAVVKAQANVDSTSSAVALAETHITAVSSAVVKAQANVDSVSAAVVKAQANADSVSSAYYSHAGDKLDPHGTNISQTCMTISGAISAAYAVITSDYETASGAYIPNVVYIADGGTEPTASNHTRGTILITYTP